MMSREWALALSGELNEYLENADRHVLMAARHAMIETIQAIEERMERMVARAGLGKLEKTVSSQIYPERGLSREPVGIVYVRERATHIFEAFEEGVTIRSGAGGKLAIPIPDSPADRIHFGKDPARNQKTKLEWFKDKGIEIKLIPGNLNRPAMLVADSVRLGMRGKTDRVRISRAKRLKSGGLAKSAVMVPLFWLVEESRMPKRLSWKSEQAQAMSNFMSVFVRHFNTRLQELRP